MKMPCAIAATLLALLGGCTQKADGAGRAKVIAAIQQAEEAQAADVSHGDIDRAMSVFAENGTLSIPGFPTAHGRAEIRAIHERSLKDPALNTVIDESSRKWWVSTGGDFASTVSAMTWTHTDAKTGKVVTDRLLSQTTWEKQADGSWKNVFDINGVYPGR